MKVWVLLEDFGHEGKSIIGIYSSHENADRVRNERRNDDDVLEEWELDERLGWKHGPVHFVAIDANTKDVIVARASDQWRDPGDSGAYCPYRYGGGQVHANATSTVSMEHAVELARAAAAEWLDGRR
jgi:hypothetical protein